MKFIDNPSGVYAGNGYADDDDELDEHDERYTNKLKQVTKERDDYKLKCEQLTKQLEELKKQLAAKDSEQETKPTESKPMSLFDEVMSLAVEVEPKRKAKHAIVDKFNKKNEIVV